MLEYSESGPAGAPTLLLLHGGGVSGWMWRPVVERLGDFHCLVPDLPEHGRNLATAPFSIVGAAEELASLIRAHAHDGRAHVVGLSLGAQVALQLAAAHPECVASLVVTGTSLRPSPERQHPMGRGLVKALMGAYWPWRMRPWLLRANRRGFGVPDAFEAEFADDTRKLTVDTMLRVVFDESQAFGLPAGLRGVTVPTLVLVGQREAPPVFRSATMLVEALPEAWAGVVPEGGHNWPLEQPDRAATVVRAWLSQVGLPAGLLPLPSHSPEALS